MARKAKIPETLHKEILAKSALGSSSTEISAWLYSAHNISINNSNVAKLIKRHTDERNDITKSIYATAVSDTATKDLQIVDCMIQSLEKQYFERLEKQPAVANGFAKTLALYLNYKSNLLGGDSPSDKTFTNEVLISNLLGKLGQ